MEHGYKISIIVPVFNTEIYLPCCLESLINQTYKHIEIICINDGSTDNSLQILENFAHRDKRIKIVNQENQGVSAARNNGLSHATGDYVIFVDSDDFVNTYLCEILVDNITNNNTDIIYFNHFLYSKNRIREIKQKENLTTNNNISFNKTLYGNIWNKAFKLSFLQEYSLTFPLEFKIAEDMIFLLKVLSHKPKLSFINSGYYFYRVDNNNSATHTTSKIIDLRPSEYWIKTDEYQKLQKEEQLATIDFFAQLIFSGWTSNKTKNKDINKQNEQIIDTFLKYYNAFNYKDYKRLIGYNKLKYRYIWRLLKQIRNIYFSIIYRSKNEK